MTTQVKVGEVVFQVQTELLSRLPGKEAPLNPVYGISIKASHQLIIIFFKKKKTIQKGAEQYAVQGASAMRKSLDKMTIMAHAD